LSRGIHSSPEASCSILVVDDEPGVRNFLRDALTGVGYLVFEAGNGRDAVQLVETSEVDLAIIDLAMPEQDGFETIQILHRVRPQLRIIAISGRFAGLLHTAERLGAKATLAKPIRPDALLGAVSRVMDGLAGNPDEG